MMICNNPRTSTLLILLGILAGLMYAPSADAQSFEQIEERLSNVNAYFYHAQPGATTIQVYALGTLRYPGLYVVAQGTDLGKLLALSGGPIQNVLRSGNERKVIIRLSRPSSDSEEPIYEVVLEDGEMLDPTNYPTLQDGDVLQVQVVERSRFSWRDALSIVNTAAVIALAVLRYGGP